MKLQLASMAALMLMVGATASAESTAAGLPGTVETQCVPVKVDRHSIHQRCTVTHTLPDGSAYTSVYWIDQNGIPYIPAN